MHGNTIWTEARWPDTSSQRGDLDRHIRAYQRLHLIARGLGKVDDEHMFFRKKWIASAQLRRGSIKCYIGFT